MTSCDNTGLMSVLNHMTSCDIITGLMSALNHMTSCDIITGLMSVLNHMTFCDIITGLMSVLNHMTSCQEAVISVLHSGNGLIYTSFFLHFSLL